MLESAYALQTAFAKKRGALGEGVDLSSLITPQEITVISEPYPHVVVDNFFKPEFYTQVEGFFNRSLARGLSEEADMSRFHPFLDLRGKQKEYDGYLYIPWKEEDPVISLFLSLTWNLFFAELFGQPTDWATTLAMHHHPPGNRTGFVHSDYGAKNFTVGHRLDNGVIYREQENLQEGDPGVFTSMRVLAVILYLVDEDGSESQGGGTGLYGDTGLEPHTIIAPRANRLLAFQISPASFHAFQHNDRERNSFIQWFHMNRSWCKKQYGFI